MQVTEGIPTISNQLKILSAGVARQGDDGK